MTSRTSVGAVLASALRKVVGGQLTRSGLGHVWRDDFTWLELARELDKAFGGQLVLLDKADFDKLVADANQMREIRRRFAAYEALRTKEHKREGGRSRNAYAQWAAENMPPKEGT